MRYEFQTVLKTDKMQYSKWLVLCVVGILIGAFALIYELKPEHRQYLATLSGICILISIILSTDKTTIILDGYKLRIERTILIIPVVKQYNVDRIENLNFSKNVRSKIYTSRGHVKVMGLDVTPESMKKYYYHPEIIEFNYEGKKITIGRFKKEFNAKLLIGKINMKQNNLAQHRT